ncbi:unnamed protein product [Thelazia callipaeda]|uniref:Tyrosine-protein phosphatase domain-containing protein n=1 Tax=Thelazia callipaeda TaxID=103827 RepID=A0A0N5CQL3_THECL|nr:unnamed protein product [Thelazia callipaeda]
MSDDSQVADSEEVYDDVNKKGTMSPQEVVDEIAKGGEQVIIDWHNIILKEPPKFDKFLDKVNALKNRYPNVILYDRSRVKLQGDKPGDDYYHASYVDSYERPDGYILAQAPFDETTESDFWRMIYQTNAKLIVLLTDVHNREGNRLIKHFWPDSNANTRTYSHTQIKVEYTSCENIATCDLYNFVITGPAPSARTPFEIMMLHYRKWIEDKAIPENLLELRSEVKRWDLQKTKRGITGPICLMCPTGVHRSGTFAVLDIVLDRVCAEKKVAIDFTLTFRLQLEINKLYQEKGVKMVGLLETASIVRKQRYGCMTHYSHYSCVADLIVRYAVATGIVDITRISQKQ